MGGRIDRGAGSVAYEMADEGIVLARMRGLVLPANAGELSALLLRAASERAARGVLCSVQQALVALPTIDAQHYRYVPAELRDLPVAVVVLPEQMAVYQQVTQAAAQSGTLRRAFLCHDQAQHWLRQQLRSLAANRAWWFAHRSP